MRKFCLYLQLLSFQELAIKIRNPEIMGRGRHDPD
jgi:hypothetical protein